MTVRRFSLSAVKLDNHRSCSGGFLSYPETAKPPFPHLFAVRTADRLGGGARAGCSCASGHGACAIGWQPARHIDSSNGDFQCIPFELMPIDAAKDAYSRDQCGQGSSLSL